MEKSFLEWAGEAEVACSNCHLKHLGSCPFVMGKPCVCCGEPVTQISMSGDSMCGYCDAGQCHKKPKTPKCTETHRKTMERFYAKFHGN